jgi:hypothetical protein
MTRVLSRASPIGLGLLSSWAFLSAELGAQTPETPGGLALSELRAELRVRPGERVDLSVFLPAGAEVPEPLASLVDRGEAVRRPAPEEDEEELFWVGLTDARAVEILRETRGTGLAISLDILLTEGAFLEDIWGLQAALTQAGIRRVRIVSGVP